jgi:hypothetical protein
LDISFICWFRVLYCVCVVFVAEEVDGVGDEGSSDTMIVYVQTLLEVFLNIPLRSACFIDEAFSGEK